MPQYIFWRLVRLPSEKDKSNLCLFPPNLIFFSDLGVAPSTSNAIICGEYIYRSTLFLKVSDSKHANPRLKCSFFTVLKQSGVIVAKCGF